MAADLEMAFDEIHEEFYDDLIDSSHIQFFMVQSCLLLRGDQENQLEGTPLPSGGGGAVY